MHFKPHAAFSGTALLLAGSITLAATGTASADILTSDDILRVVFKVDNNWSPVAPDVMTFNFGLVDVLAAYTTRHAALYDGNTLLGTASSSSFGGHVGLLSLNPAASFAAPGSPWSFDNFTNVDFTTIVDGSIDGRIDFTLETGSMDIDLANINLSFIKASSCCGGTVVTPVPTINSIDIITKEPCVGDLDGNGVVDAADLAILLGSWGPCVGCPSDLNGDNVVDAADLAMLLGSWGRCL